MSKHKKGDVSQDAIPTTPALDDGTDVVPSADSTPVIDNADTDVGAASAADAEMPPVLDPDAAVPSDDEFGEDAPNDKEPSVPTFDEYVEAGYDAAGYHRRFGRNPRPNTERAKREAAQAFDAAQPKVRGGHAGLAKYVVWAHGSLQCNGTLYLPGDTVDLNAAQAEAIGECVSLADRG